MPAVLALETANAPNRFIRRAIAATLATTSLHQILMNERGHDKTQNRGKPRFHGPSRNTPRHPRTSPTQKLVPLWASIRTFNQDEQTIVVLPSITIDVDIKGAEIQAYEERFLLLLLLLRQPRAPDLHNLAIHPAEHHRLLPRAFAGRHR
jgi:hypothetical protein